MAKIFSDIIPPRAENHPLRLLIIVVVLVFICEVVAMLLLHFINLSNFWLIAVFDACLLVVLFFPSLYYFVYQSLNRQIHTLSSTREKLYESQKRLLTLFQTSPDSITVSRLDDGVIIDVNNGFSRLTGYAREEVIGRSSLDIPLWKSNEDRRQLTDVIQKQRLVENFETKLIRKDGIGIIILISSKVVSLSGEEHIVSVARDITGIKRTQNRLRVSNELLEKANRHNDINALLDDFSSYLYDQTSCSVIEIGIHVNDCQLKYHACKGGKVDQDNSTVFFSIYQRCKCPKELFTKTGVNGLFWTDNGSILINSVKNLIAGLSLDETHPLYEICKIGYESVVFVPIRSAGSIFSTIYAADLRENFFSKDIVNIIEIASAQMGSAVDRLIAEDKLRKSYDVLEEKVLQRTSDLTEANRKLSLEIEERRKAEESLLSHQQKLRSLSSQLLLAEERERRRIATALHDRIGQNLAISKIKLGGLRQMASSPEIKNAADEVRSIIETTIEDTRSLSFELSPPSLNQIGLVAALEELAETIGAQHGIDVTFRSVGGAESIQSSQRVIAYMCVRELLLNVVKHAQTRRASLSVELFGDMLRVIVEDDGVGFYCHKLGKTDGRTAGFGIFSVRERLMSLSGDLDIKSEPGMGTRAIMQLPLSDDHRLAEGDKSWP